MEVRKDEGNVGQARVKREVGLVTEVVLQDKRLDQGIRHRIKEG